MHDQSQSQLFLIPGELRNKIYRLCLTSSVPVVDACIPARFSPTIRSRSHNLPPLGVALIRSCKRAFSEVPAKLLYTSNFFRFTTSTHAHRFLSSLPPKQAALIATVELDISCQSDIIVAREWCQYLSWEPSCGIWAWHIGSLHADLPMLRTLRLDTGGDMTELLFKGVFMHQKALDRVVVTGSAIRYAKIDNLTPSTRKISLVFESSLIVCAMANSVAGGKEEKLVKWGTKDEQLVLEVVNRRAASKVEQHAVLASLEAGKDLPLNGLATLIEYESATCPPNINPIADE